MKYPSKLIDQDIQKVVPRLGRTKDIATGAEYLFYNVDLLRKSYMEGPIDGIVVWNWGVDPATNEIIPDATKSSRLTKT
jgi:hypothetical protein